MQSRKPDSIAPLNLNSVNLIAFEDKSCKLDNKSFSLLNNENFEQKLSPRNSLTHDVKKRATPIVCSTISLLNINIRSIKNKSHLFELEIDRLSCQPDIINLTEHWFKGEVAVPIAGYECANFFSRDEKEGSGGSAIYSKNDILYSTCDQLRSLSIESICEISVIELKKITGNILLPSTSFLIISVYRAPSQKLDDINSFFGTLESLLIHLTQKSCYFFVSGDFNFDLLDSECKHTKSFLGLLASFNVEPIFKDTPSRVSKDTATLIDNCFSNLPHLSASTHDLGLSDHYAQIVTLDLSKFTHVTKNSFINRRIWSVENKFNFCQKLCHSLSIFDHLNDPSMDFERFKDIIYNTMETCCPLKNFKPTPCNKFCYTEEIMNLAEEKMHFHLLHKNFGIRQFKTASNKANKKLKKEIYKLKRETYSSQISGSKNKSKKVWNIIRSETSSASDPIISSIKHEDIVINNPLEIANAFNSYFVNITNAYSASVNEKEALSYVEGNISNQDKNLLSFTFHTIDLIQLNNIVSQLKPSKSDKLGDTPTFIFKDFFHVLGPSLLELINTCLINGVFPEFMKLGKITPIHKKGDKQLLSNYRPISILHTMSKILEKAMYDQLYSYFEQNNLFSDKQFGFRKKKSTIEAVQQLLDNIFKAFENKETAISMHFDLAKAFDMVNHKLLLKKLKVYGLRDSAIKLIESYLTGRKQVVKINSAAGPIFSDTESIKSGIPQGSILGPLLFIIFINDLPKSVKAPTYLFADDTSSVLCGEDAIEKIKIVYQDITHWFIVNGLYLNETKSQVVFYSLCNSSPPESLVNNVTETMKVPIADSAGILGLSVDCKLKWTNQIDTTVRKVQKQKWALRNLVKIATPNSALIFYHACILSCFRYGIVLWGRSPYAETAFIEQKKIIRILFNKPYNHHCRELFIQNQLLTLPSLYIFESLKFSVEKGMLKPSDMVPAHTYNSRHNFINSEKVNLATSNYNVRISAVQIFNALPLQLKKLFKNDELNSFFKQLKVFVLEKAFYHVNELLT